jgi:alpha-ketoglutarate-dependent taurine dioxygenase
VQLITDPSTTSVVPLRQSDPAAARAHYDRHGAVVLPDVGADPADLAEAVRALFGSSVRSIGEAVEVRAAGGRDRPDLDADGHRLTTPLHTDGFALADGAPDVLALGCVHAATDGGGASFLADLDLVADRLRDGDADQRELARFLIAADIDQTEPGKFASIGPVGLRVDEDRTAWRCSAFLRPTEADEDPARTEALIARWRTLLAELEPQLVRFELRDGDALVVDNTRLVHGRDPYGDTGRLLWRLWAWTDRAVVPGTAYTGSDTSRISA